MLSTKTIILFLGILVILIAGGVIYWFVTKHPQVQSDQGSQTQETSSPATFAKKVFFVHHSTGEIYWNGGMEKALVDAGYEAAAPWWDGNTDPGDFYGEFSNPDSWSKLEPYSIIIFKSCFPASSIDSEAKLAEYKTAYSQLYEIYRSHPDKLFVPLSTPPLLKNHTTAEDAQRALDFEIWLTGEYKEKYDGKNLAPFKLHSLLSDSAGYLKAEFIASAEDDHPNAHAGEVLGPAIVEHLKSWVE